MQVGWVKIGDFRQIAGYISKTVQDRRMVSVSCQKWVHKKCSGIKGSMSKVAKSFICRGCLNPVTSAVVCAVSNGDIADDLE